MLRINHKRTQKKSEPQMGCDCEMRYARWPLLANESSVAQRLEHDLEHGGSWVRIPSGAQIFSVSFYGWFFTSPFISFIYESQKFIK